ncbi:phosphoenolpyruvate--protein phosphotransferase [Escherichia coli]|nr:phosphoenolpyruvate--protein phosphotransferase [Escherichia coli]EKY5389986.1 phosphoenolpyruvate--protein phosphotransferase [Escherichia coli]
MALIVEFICELPNGVHARPASHVETLCNTFSSQIEWHNLRTDRKGNAKSALALIGTDTLAGDNCQLLISGADEQEAHQRLSQWLRDEFPHCDAPLAEVKSDELEPLPVSLTNLNPQIIRARTVCSGSAGGILTPISSLDLNALGNLPAAKGVDAEQSALENGLTLVLKNIEFRLLDSDGATSAILEAHRSLAGDTSLREHLLAGVSAGLSCAEAIVASANHFCEEFSRSSSSYLQERALDVRDVCFQLLQQIYGEQRFPAPGKLTQPAICMADELTPSQFLELDKNHLKGLLLKSGGTTSHTVILARSFNIPTLVGVDIDALTPWQQQTIYIDGNAGAIVVEPGEAVARYYQQEARVQDALREQQRVWLTQQARTADGIRIEIAANIAHSVEAQAAFGNGAEGVGLFRTEMLYMDRTSAPGESELYNIFCQALESANGRSIIVRTMDIGGDKPVDYLNIPAEANPFLGYRAVRIYEEYASLFTTQLRSILRASAHGSLKIMIPMISSMEEILWVKEKLAEAKQQLRNEHIPFDEKIQLGIMLEVPSVMFIIDQCCEEIDFFSIGSNDLTQYLLAVEHLLAQFRMTQQDAPLVTAECITLESDWRSKEEVLKGMTDNLLLAGRCRYPRKLEADLWAREAVFSTGLGFSFAIPHSKSEHIEQSTISVARLQAPVRWGDDEAQFIIMLTLNKHAAGDQHMRIFSRLARRIMHEEFRNALVNAASADAIASLLQHELEL